MEEIRKQDEKMSRAESRHMLAEYGKMRHFLFLMHVKINLNGGKCSSACRFPPASPTNRKHDKCTPISLYRVVHNLGTYACTINDLDLLICTIRCKIKSNRKSTCFLSWNVCIIFPLETWRILPCRCPQEASCAKIHLCPWCIETYKLWFEMNKS